MSAMKVSAPLRGNTIVDDGGGANSNVAPPLNYCESGNNKNIG